MLGVLAGPAENGRNGEGKGYLAYISLVGVVIAGLMAFYIWDGSEPSIQGMVTADSMASFLNLVFLDGGRVVDPDLCGLCRAARSGQWRVLCAAALLDGWNDVSRRGDQPDRRVRRPGDPVHSVVRVVRLQPEGRALGGVGAEILPAGRLLFRIPPLRHRTDLWGHGLDEPGDYRCRAQERGRGPCQSLRLARYGSGHRGLWLQGCARAVPHVDA